MKRIVTHLIKLQQELQQLANPKQKEILQRFFKTGVGEYGEGDVFLGIKVPVQRKVAKKYQTLLSLVDIETLLKSKIHEYRFTASFFLNIVIKKLMIKKPSSIFIFTMHNILIIGI